MKIHLNTKPSDKVEAVEVKISLELAGEKDAYIWVRRTMTNTDKATISTNIYGVVTKDDCLWILQDAFAIAASVKDMLDLEVDLSKFSGNSLGWRSLKTHWLNYNRCPPNTKFEVN